MEAQHRLGPDHSPGLDTDFDKIESTEESSHQQVRQVTSKSAVLWLSSPNCPLPALLCVLRAEGPQQGASRFRVGAAQRLYAIPGAAEGSRGHKE